MLKVLIVLLMVALLLSLASGFFFLMTDQGDKQRRRTAYSLGVRVSLAVGLMILVIYGLASGQLGSKAPWDRPPVSRPSPD